MVILFEIVGSADVFQQTPREVILAPPSLVIVPPLTEVVCVTPETAIVITTGGEGLSFLQELIIKNERMSKITPEILLIFFIRSQFKIIIKLAILNLEKKLVL